MQALIFVKKWNTFNASYTRIFTASSTPHWDGGFGTVMLDLNYGT